MSKTCCRCGETKDLSDFKNRSDSPDGKRNDCRVCSGKREAVRRQKPEVKERILAVQKVRRKRNYNPAVNRDQLLRWKYGITNADYEVMYAKQDGKCVICGDAHDVLAIDHCHVTGAVRQLLCGPCNKGLGHFRDTPDLLIAGAAYLMEHQWQNSMAATASLPTQRQ